MKTKYRQNKTDKKAKGFTLIELLVVIVIVGILAAIALPQYRKAAAKAELAQIINAVKAISNAQERYFLAQGTYAISLGKLDVGFTSVNNIHCTVTTEYARCYNKNFYISHYYSQATDNYTKNLSECFARNKILATACEVLFGTEASSGNSGPCERIGGKPCYRAETHMPIF